MTLTEKRRSLDMALGELARKCEMKPFHLFRIESGTVKPMWGPYQAFTYVQPAKIKSVNPGACFKHAGWCTMRDWKTCEVRMSLAGAHLLTKFLRRNDGAAK